MSDPLERVRAALIERGDEPSPARIGEALRREGIVLGDQAMLGLVDMLHDEIRGLGPLQDLVGLPGVTDVLVAAPDQVWIDRGHGLELADAGFRDEAAVRRLAQRLAAAGGRRLDDAAPYADLRLADGTRFHAVLAPVAASGTCISLRIPRRHGFTLGQLVDAGTIDADGERWLSALVHSRASFLVSGGTGSGKTTLLSTLLSTVDERDRIVIVEDSGELVPQHRHVVRLEARPANVEGAGCITVRDLVRQALRMRPDRLVVGEVRGAEVVDLLAALNTGHEGGCGTVHANSADDVPARLESLALAAGLGREALHAQVAAGIDAVVHLGRDRSGQRRLRAIAGVEEGERGVRCLPAITWSGEGATPGPLHEHLALRVGLR